MKSKINLLSGPVGQTGPSGPIGPTGAVGPDNLSLTQFQGFPENTLSLIPIGLTGGNGAALYHGGCLAPNGKIYAIPGTDIQMPQVLVIDPTNDTFSTINRESIGGGWRGGVLASNGKIYCAPLNLKILVIDTTDNSLSTIDVPEPIYRTTNLFWGAVYAEDKVIFIPFDSYKFLVIDIKQNEYLPFYPVGLDPPNPLPPPPTLPLTNPWGAAQQSNFWAGGVLGIDGNIYTVPHNETNSNSILRINPKTLTYQTAVNFVASSGDFFLFDGGVLHPNGEIYLIPRRGIGNNRKIYKLGPPDIYNTISALEPPSTDIPINYNTIFYGGILSQNGSIYCIPGPSRFIKIIGVDGLVNQGIDVSNLYPLPANANYRLWFGGVCAPNGKIYLMPWSTPNIGVIKVGLPKLPPWMLQSFFNKY
jgi:hypothetical protein